MSRYQEQLQRSLSAVLCVLAACLALGASAASAAPKGAPHCVTPTGVDVNERYGVTEAIVAAFCAEINSGRHWTVSNGWFMSAAYDAMPAGFVPEGATPLDDFLAKFIGVKYVVDPGTRQERVYMFPSDDDLGLFSDPVQDVVNTVTLGTLKPLSVGDHVVDTYFVMRALHCDGFGDVIDENCLPAGDVLFTVVPFAVTPGHH
jgi:hypothetical protein